MSGILSESDKCRGAVEKPAASHAVILDWVRFGAALVVLLCHARGMFFVDYGSLQSSSKNYLVAASFALTRIGAEAVITFFVLSGFFVAGVSSQKLLERKFSLSKYAVDRLTRVYVPYVPALLLTWVCEIALGRGPSLGEFLGNVVGLQGTAVQCFGGNAPLWSLAYEIWFYALFGLVAYLFVSREGARSSLIFFAGALACAVIFSTLDATFLFCWLFGGVAYFFRNAASSTGRCLLALLAIAFGAVAIELQSPSNSIAAHWVVRYLPPRPVGELTLACGVAILLPVLSSSSVRINNRGWVARSGQFLASFSFSLYLIHYPVLKWISKYVDKSDVISFYSFSRFSLVLLISLFSAWMFYMLFEKQTALIRRLLNRWANGR